MRHLEELIPLWSANEMFTEIMMPRGVWEGCGEDSVAPVTRLIDFLYWSHQAEGLTRIESTITIRNLFSCLKSWKQLYQPVVVAQFS